MKVIKSKNMPARAPVFQTLCTWIALDYFNAPGWAWGAVGLLFIFIWIAFFIQVFTQDAVDLFEGN